MALNYQKFWFAIDASDDASKIDQGSYIEDAVIKIQTKLDAMISSTQIIYRFILSFINWNERRVLNGIVEIKRSVQHLCLVRCKLSTLKSNYKLLCTPSDFIYMTSFLEIIAKNFDFIYNVIVYKTLELIRPLMTFPEKCITESLCLAETLPN